MNFFLDSCVMGSSLLQPISKIWLDERCDFVGFKSTAYFFKINRKFLRSFKAKEVFVSKFSTKHFLFNIAIVFPFPFTWVGEIPYRMQVRMGERNGGMIGIKSHGERMGHKFNTAQYWKLKSNPSSTRTNVTLHPL